MNILSVYSPQVEARPENDRPNAVRRDTQRTDATRSRASSPDQRIDEDAVPERRNVGRKNPRVDFATLLALLADAGPKVRAELLAQIPADGVSLIDKFLDGTAQSFGGDATDALRYGILTDQRAATTGDGAFHTVLSQTNEPALSTATTREPVANDAHQHAREILSRIATTRGTSADQLKALGDEEAADLRVALDALLARAGTPSGLAIAGAAETAAASAIASATANTRNAADVSIPVVDTNALAPELQYKLGRVIERMKSEYGHDVKVVETVRSQERQDFLFEQGRTRPGDIVTWTRTSAHALGDAVDVNIDGKWNNAEGFARLQRIAREEGLRTLGVRDPGHLELADASRSQNTFNARFNASVSQARNTTPLVATPAMQSGIAQVAQVAGAAGVARIAEPGVGRGTYTPREGAGGGVADGLKTDSVSAVSATTASNSGQGASGRGLGEDASRSSQHERAMPPVRNNKPSPPGDATLMGAPSIVVPVTGTTSAVAAQHAGASAGVRAAERVADMQDQRDNAPAGSMSRMTLSVDAPDGGQDRITVDVRGTSVGTRIDTDSINADRLRMHTADLQDALGRHGLESESVRIGSTARTDTTDARLLHGERDGAKLVAAQQSAGNEGAMNHGQRERAALAREWERQETARDTARDTHDEQQRDASKRGAREDAHDGHRGRRETFNWSNT